MNYNDRLNYGTVRVLDCEVYPNFFLIALDNPHAIFFTPQALLEHLWTTYSVENPCTIVTYNGLAFDFPLLQKAYEFCMRPITDQATRTEVLLAIKGVANDLIANDKGFQPRLGLPAGVRHIDVMGCCPPFTSLKLLGARLGCESIQDLPYHHETVLTPEQAQKVIEYCLHDLEVTRMVFNDRKGAIDLREWEQKNLSDAQMAERTLVPDRKGGKKSIPHEVEVFGYKFDINPGNGSPVDPGFPDQVVDGVTYQVGIGGLHSVDKACVFDLRGRTDVVMLGVDVASYYPSMLLGPLKGVLDEDQERIYRQIRVGRIQSKHRVAEITKLLKSADPSQVESLKAELAHHKQNDATYKISLNGTYGKLGSKYSPLYNPRAMLSVTLLGQINLLKLIRMFARSSDYTKIEVLSANTDGVECMLPVSSIDFFRQTCKSWEVETGMELEEEQVLFVARRDVNNYFMLTKSGKVKTKGIFEPASIKKSLGFEIIVESVMASFGIWRGGECTPEDIRYYITKKSQDPTEFSKFLSVRTVSGGAVINPRYDIVDDWILIADRLWQSPRTGKNSKRVSRPKPYELFVGGDSVGRVVRWYIGVTGANVYTPKGGKVALTDNAVLVQDFREKPTTQIDVEWYINRAEKLRSALLTGGVFNEEE